MTLTAATRRARSGSPWTAPITRSTSAPRTAPNCTQALESYIRHARRTGGTARRAPRGHAGEQAVDTHKVREWAKDNGFDVKERGRVPADVLASYKAAGLA